MGVLPLDSLIPLVRLHIYEAMTIEGYDTVDAEYISQSIDADVPASYVKMAFRQLSASKDMDYELKRGVGGDSVATGQVLLTAKGVKAVEKDLMDEESLVSRYQESGIGSGSITLLKSAFVPASDRLVLYSDNQEAANTARLAVEKLHEKVIQTNDLPKDLIPFKDTVVVELGALRELISQTVVRASVVIAIARRILPWIADKAGSAAIGELAKRALTALIGWLI